MAFLHGVELTRAIREAISHGPADIAVAYWGNDAVTRLGLPDNLANYRIACDARSGFCSPQAIKELIERGADVVDVVKLHAKVYRSSRMLVVASANASGRGLSEDGLAMFGLEAGMSETLPDRIRQVEDWFDRVHRAGRSVTAADIPEIRRLWDRARSARPMRQSLLESVIGDASALADRQMRVYLFSSVEADDGLVQIYKSSPYFDAKLWESWRSHPFFWGEMPRTVSVGDEFLCFEVSDAKAECDGVWRILASMGTGDRKVWPATLISEPFGFTLGSTDELDRRVSEAVAAGRLQVDIDPISLFEFAAAISDRHAEDEHLLRIRSDETRGAYKLLAASAGALGFTNSYKTGRVPALKWHDRLGRYLFSFIPNQGHLLFYLRTPALEADSTLLAQARTLGLNAKTNNAGEETLRVRTIQDAETLLNWMRGIMPLP